MSEDIALDRRLVWEVKAPFRGAARWLRILALVNAKREREREWSEPDKYAAEAPFLKNDWPWAS